MYSHQETCIAQRLELMVIKCTACVRRDHMLADLRSFVACVTKVTELCATLWLSAAAQTARPLGTRGRRVSSPLPDCRQSFCR